MMQAQQSPFQQAWAPLECLPSEVLEKLAEFVGDIAIITASEEADHFSENIIDSPASNTWGPSYHDMQSLALVSSSFKYPAQRALFQVAVLKTTSGLMRFVQSLLMYPDNRRHVRYLVAVITDYDRALPIRSRPPQPLVLREFYRKVYRLLSTPQANVLPENGFLRRTLQRAIDILLATPRTLFAATVIQIIRVSGINFHAIEDQVLTTAVQLCTRIKGVRFCFGEPMRHSLPPRPITTNMNPILPIPPAANPSYSSLLRNHPLRFTSLTLDFGSLYSLINLRSFERGYPTGLPPSIERLTLVGNRVDSELPYELFTIERLAGWLRTNHQLRELRLVDDFDKMVRYADNRLSHNVNPGPLPAHALNWNDILRSYRNTLELLEMGWDKPSALGMKAKFGESGQLDCLPEMNSLRYLKAPLVSLGGNFIVPLSNDENLIESVKTGFPASLRNVDLMVVNPPQTRAERDELSWRFVEFQL
ncbi:hypothetical protein B0T09DRAFT_396374 [Sordaria sp. MPI-SDFR-AT-0083]|nr:hypothetical protein B0T09DRAFT_396374 [Sordaria sp. MPI-SDFR-AT-0083]